MSPLRLTTSLAMFAAILMALAPLAARAGEGPVVVELFTSQGCSSCPPADAYLRDLAKRTDVIALSYNVDYWDYLGWKDTLASLAHTERQRAYARTLGLSGVYTPQIVVNGIAEGVGSRRHEIEPALESAKPLPVSISFTGEGDALSLSVGPGETPERPATLWLVRYTKEERVEISRGENRGRTVAYAHAVRELTPIGMWKGQAMELTLPKSDLLTRGFEGCAALLQAGDGGPILGAARMESTQAQ
ncbi:DUF1223 domain-containing protein [Parvibaculum sp.]|uniref:DUF1223 domain-containing protein n=1 Tax=Parvibaculum sp. TaxID=2024848 RepID=UPI000C59F649|nr:DUF1223 domain-containing protein [Parvibaculum sp.]HAC59213.1 hypothetical protein [Rhodobiaceae bacterium]MAU61071.1 hypothetical protein [Parvibaculum sp.]MBO6668533.1 DUF1223 domain-containing protein [Parvibaculum sp.]MBO6691147.1 DUF1223 domain-containing protein [Parvibaculum sp.]MBO6714209.1 DUF1223 domain-containing protein [Parvibaculum sp.]